MIMVVKVNRCFILLLLFTSLSTSIFTITRKDEGDWFSGSQCQEHDAYVHDSGCHCYHGLTFSTESMKCQTYQERGNEILKY